MALTKVSRGLLSTGIVDNSNATAITINSSEEVTFAAKITAVGTSIFTDLDISGNVDVDGTTNLDVVDIDGAVNMATTALVTGVLTTTAATVFNGGFASNAASTVSVTSSSATEVAAFKVSGDTTPSIAIYSNNAIRAKLRASSAETALLSQGTLPLLLGTNNTERMRLDGSTGKLLIGAATNTTGDAVQIESPASGGGFGIQIRRNDNNTSQQVGQIKFGNAVDEDLGKISVNTDGANNSGAILLSTASAGTTAERMRINSEGSLLVGTTANDGAIANTVPVTAGRFRTLSGAQAAANNTATTMFTMPAGFATYLINTGFNGINNAAAFGATVIVHTDGTTTSITQLVNPSGMTISLSGMAVQATQTSGATLNISFSALRM